MPKSALLSSHIAQRDRFSALDHTDLTEDERQSVIRLALLVLASQHEPRKILSTPKDTCAYLRLLLTDRKNEVFGAIFLDNRHRIITTEELFYGTIDGTTVHPRVVVQRALELNSAALIAFHNHPSGAIEPSKADQTITTRLKEVLALVDIRLLTTSLSQRRSGIPCRAWLDLEKILVTSYAL